jgi:hypothetical protein
MGGLLAITAQVLLVALQLSSLTAKWFVPVVI